MAGREVADRPDSGARLSGSAQAQGAETLGEVLRRARQQRGLTIQQIAATTRIPARHFEALERDDIGAVPGGMYLRAEVGTYADAVGLSRSTALAYLHTADPPVAPSSAAHGTVVSMLRRASTLSVVMASFCLVLVAVVIWAPYREPGPAPATDIPLAATADTAVVAATSGVNEPRSDIPSDTALVVTEPPRAPPVAEPELEVVTEPPGARVTMDGVGWGVTPVTISYLPPGAKQLRVTRDGYAAEQRLIRISADQQRTTVHIALQPVGGQ